MPRNEFKASDEESEDKPPYNLTIDMQHVVNEALAKEVRETPVEPPYEHMHEWEIRAHEEATEAVEPPGPPIVNELSGVGLEALRKRAAEGSVTAQHQLDLLMRDRER